MSMIFGGLKAVQNVNLEVRPREIVGLIGPNGAGKTTCFNMITGVYTPTEGVIEFLGSEVQGLRPATINHRGIARTFQNIRLFKNLSVFDNVRTAMHRSVDYHLISALLRTKKFRQTEARIADETQKLLGIFDLNHKATTVAGSLPYGEQRKLEIVRALATKPQLLLLDEPAAGMNPQETTHLTQLILRIREEFNLAILLIEHDMSLVMKICERIYVLDYGKEIAQGVPREIQKNPAVIKAYLGEE
jgi:branched-chain amino acid transport system ATP-binding protein